MKHRFGPRLSKTTAAGVAKGNKLGGSNANECEFAERSVVCACCFSGRRDGSGKAVVSVFGGSLGPAFQHGESSDEAGLRSSGEGLSALEHLRVVSPYEGRLLDSGRLRGGRGGETPRRENDVVGGRRLYQPQQTDFADRGLRGQRRAGRDHRRDFLRRAEQPGQRSAEQKHSCNRCDQWHVIARPVGQVARVVRRNGIQGGRIHRQAASQGLRHGQGCVVSRTAGSRLG